MKDETVQQDLPQIPPHYHDGVDQPRILPKDLMGFTILRSIPTYKAQEGTPVFVIIPGSPDTYFLYVMLDRSWRGVQLPL